jgi:hypothetical protein
MANAHSRVGETREVFDSSAPQPKRGPVDIANAQLDPAHFTEPEVNRLKEWALGANAELAGERVAGGALDVMPLGRSIMLMVAISLALWGLIAAAIWPLL